MLLKFEVQTKPVPQARPRFFSQCKKCRLKHLPKACENCKRHSGAYDPDRSKSFKEVVAWHAKTAVLKQGLQKPAEGPISINLIFRMGKNGKEMYHTKRPDIDNLAKAVKDALKGIVYADDSQIVEAHLYKQYGGPEVGIEIRTMEEA